MTDIDAFQAARPRLQRLAYRMLGGLADAEDAVQDTWLRWQGTDRSVISEPEAWLVTATTRLCLDRLRAQRRAREAYRGPWLPEPLIEELQSDPVERAEEVSVAFLLALQRLSPLERAVFLLREVFDQDYDKVARCLGRSESACRQLAARARSHVREARPRFEVPQAEAEKLVAAFLAAAQSDDPRQLSELLAQDAVMITDGGGKRRAALRPLVGREDIMGFVAGLRGRGRWGPFGAIRPARINGYPGVIVEIEGGLQTVAFQPGEDGRIAAIYVVRNPDKLARVSL
jgi:RNA polymerase sigma-70 factor (ECF subfamily)